MDRVPIIRRKPFVFEALSAPPSPKRTPFTKDAQAQVSQGIRHKCQVSSPLKRRMIFSLNPSLESTPQPVAIYQMPSPRNCTPGGTTKSFQALVQSAESQKVFPNRNLTFLSTHPQTPQSNSRMNYFASSSSVPTPQMHAEVYLAFKQAMQDKKAMDEAKQVSQGNSQVSLSFVTEFVQKTPSLSRV